MNVSRKSTLKPSTKPLARKPFQKFIKHKPMKSKQRAVTPAEKAHWDRLASLGCIACMKDGKFEPRVSIHHIDGRTKPGCHMLVIPLCASHHQDGTGDDKSLLAVHPWKARFEKRYGLQENLVKLCMSLIGE